jgi:hypothetical protein
MHPGPAPSSWGQPAACLSVHTCYALTCIQHERTLLHHHCRQAHTPSPRLIPLRAASTRSSGCGSTPPSPSEASSMTVVRMPLGRI